MVQMEWICEAVAIAISFSIVIDDFMSINIIWCEFQMKCFPLHLNSDSDSDSVFSCRFHLIFFPIYVQRQCAIILHHFSFDSFSDDFFLPIGELKFIHSMSYSFYYCVPDRELEKSHKFNDFMIMIMSHRSRMWLKRH